MTEQTEPIEAADISGIEHDLDKVCVWCSGPVVRAEKWRNGRVVYATIRCRWCLRQGGAL